MNLPTVVISLPDWIASAVDFDRAYAGDEEKMRLAVELSRQNVVRGTGGPFGAAIFERRRGSWWPWASTAWCG